MSVSHDRVAMRRSVAVLNLVAAAALALLVLGCGDARPRAVVIGMDGADWRVIDPLIAAGRMPHFASLRARGTSGPIHTLPDLALSPVIWTSVATGKVPTKHGITWFLVDRPEGPRVPVRSHNRKALALWNILAERGLRSTAIGWWATYPAEDVGPGIVVSDALGFHGFGRTAREGDDRSKVYPAKRFAELDSLIPTEQQLSEEFALRFLHIDPADYRKLRFEPGRGARDPGNPIHLFQQYAVTAQGYTAIAERLLDERYDLFLAYYEQVDSLSHLFMKHAPPRLDWVSEEEFARYRDVVTEWYAYQDELLGRLLARIDLDETAVFVLSDHGFKSGERRIRSEQAVDLRTAHLEHEPDGIFLAAGPGIRSGARIEDASVLDLAPTLLHYLKLPVAKDMDGKVLVDLFEPGTAAAREVAYVESFESPGKRQVPSEPEGSDSEEELADTLAGLQALGYVEKPGESSPEIHNNLARSHVQAGELDQAQAEFEKSLALAPHDADALLGLSGLAAIRGDRERAEHLAKVALASNPDFPPALAQLAELRREAGDLTEAIRLYGEAVKLDDVSPSLHLGLGDCLQRAGKFEEARASFQRVLQLDPDSFEAHYNLGVTAFRQQDEKQAIAQYERALAIDPKHPLAAAALNNLGTVYLDLGEKEKAIARWEQAVATSPAQFEARFNLASQYLEQKRLDDGLRLLEEAARLDPSHELVHTRLGRAYMEKGRGEDAYRALSLVHRLYPKNWFAPLGLSVLFAATERPDQARPLLAEALQLGGDVARAEATGYPALAALLAEKPTKAQR